MDAPKSVGVLYRSYMYYKDKSGHFARCTTTFVCHPSRCDIGRTGDTCVGRTAVGLLLLLVYTRSTIHTYGAGKSALYSYIAGIQYSASTIINVMVVEYYIFGYYYQRSLITKATLA